MNLSPLFTLAQLTASDTATAHGILNLPDDAQATRLQILCVVILEPVVELIGGIHITVGFRNVKVNLLVGGVPTSAHLTGDATDFVPLEVSQREACRRIARSSIPFDQLILETGCVHISQARAGEVPRHQVLERMGERGSWTYAPLRVDIAA